MDHALDDVTVLDLGQVIAMPLCTTLLPAPRPSVTPAS